MIDIDLFKHVNDTHGHQIGDVVLQNIAKIIQKEIRSRDVVERYGGEEYIVLLPNTKNQTLSLLRNEFEKTLSLLVFQTYIT